MRIIYQKIQTDGTAYSPGEPYVRGYEGGVIKKNRWLIIKQTGLIIKAIE